MEAPPVRKFTTKQVVELLQSFGVPCGIVQSAEEMHADPQLAHRGHYWKLEHPTWGCARTTGRRSAFRRRRQSLTKAAPMMGEDNE